MAEQANHSALAEKLLATLLEANGEWLTRREIAANMGRQNAKQGLPNAMPAYDQALLDELARTGVIEKDKRTRGVVAWEYVYRAVKL